MSSEEGAFFSGIVLGVGFFIILLLAVIGPAIYDSGTKYGRNEIRQAAVESGHAHRTVDSQGAVEFHWGQPNE